MESNEDAPFLLETEKFHTVYEEDEDELFDRVVCIGNTSLHLEPQLCALTSDIQQLPAHWKKQYIDSM